MPLSSPAPRQPVHQRDIRLRGFQRSDGLWDIEGHLTDIRDADFEALERGRIPAGEPIHEMWLRLTVDDELTVHGVEAASDWYPYSVCPAITGRFDALKGLRIGPGWRSRTRELVGGVNGCTHLYDLLGAVATAAFQTIFPTVVQARRETARGKADMMIDGCHAFARGSEVIRRWWPEYADPAETGDTGNRRR